MILLPILAASALIGSGNDLLAACVSDEGRRACNAMVLGVANGAMLAAQDAHQKVICPRIGLRPEDLVVAVRKYLDAHPEARSKPAPLLVYQALKDALPCPQG
jgi:Rap1a immunity proteins